MNNLKVDVELYSIQYIIKLLLLIICDVWKPEKVVYLYVISTQLYYFTEKKHHIVYNSK